MKRDLEILISTLILFLVIIPKAAGVLLLMPPQT